jgi:hypothetical protein
MLLPTAELAIAPAAIPVAEADKKRRRSTERWEVIGKFLERVFYKGLSTNQSSQFTV